MKNCTMKTLRPFGKLLLSCVAWLVARFIGFAQRFINNTTVTFGLTNHTGAVSHAGIANMFGTARELFGLSRIPGFAKDAGHAYLLKTCDASFAHIRDFGFGDIIKTVIDIVEVNGASFIVRGRFFNKKTKELHATALQTIAYTNMQGRPTRFPLWFKVLLNLSCVKEFSESKKLKKEASSEKHEVYRHKLKVTSDLTNAEKNVSHDEYAKILTQSVELYLMSQKKQHLASSLKVEEASYKYSRDFYFGDEMSIKLYIVKIKSEEIIFDAEFINMAGDVNTYGRQKFSFSQQLEGVLSMT